MPEEPIRAAGVLVVRGEPIREFLLLKHPKRWDLPKGHQEAGETDLQCALRELEEETGIAAKDIELVDGFRWETQYTVNSKRHGGRPMRKTVVFFLARLVNAVELKLTEHPSGKWFPWKPPHQIQSQTVDPLLAEAERFFEIQARSVGQ